MASSDPWARPAGLLTSDQRDNAVARPRAANYTDKRAAILHEAAVLFADQGYDRTSIADIARALGVSKALFYHYYSSKDALLFDIIRTHLLALIDVTERAAGNHNQPEVRLSNTVQAILECYRDADAEHRVQINDMKRLSEDKVHELRGLERQLVQLLSGIVSGMAPDLSPARITVLTMSIFGTLNWKFMWFRENGAISRDDYALLLADMFAAGISHINGRARVA
jgi:TetR/AcrR family transcriptional regulator